MTRPSDLPPSGWDPDSEIRGRSPWPIVGALVLGAALVAAGLGIGYVLFGEDDEPPSAAPVETSVAPEELEDPEEPEEHEEPEVPELPAGAFGEVQATMTFNADATPAQMDRIEREWRDSPLLTGVFSTSAEEMDEAMGFAVASLAAWGDADDADAVEAFVCGYADHPAVGLVGVGASPC